MFLPAFLPLGLVMTGLAVWPFLEQWITGDRREHHVNDRPRNAPTRTAVGMAGVTFYGIMWLEGANDIIASQLNISLYLTTEIARYAIFIGPVVAYWVTKRICLGLQRKDVHLLEHGVETGHHPAAAQRRVHRGDQAGRPRSKRAKSWRHGRSLPQIEAPVGDDVPAPSARGGLGKLRVSLNRVLTESIPLPRATGTATATTGTAMATAMRASRRRSPPGTPGRRASSRRAETAAATEAAPALS